MSTSYSWEGKVRYGSFRLRMNVWVCSAGKTVKSLRTSAKLSASAVMFHYDDALYQVHAPLPLAHCNLRWRAFPGRRCPRVELTVTAYYACNFAVCFRELAWNCICTVGQKLVTCTEWPLSPKRWRRNTPDVGASPQRVTASPASQTTAFVRLGGGARHVAGGQI